MPDHAHWVVTDLTDVPGLWKPRRNDWKKYLIVDPSDIPASATEAQTEVMARLVEQLQSVHLSDVKAFANTKFPLALWQQSRPATWLPRRHHVERQVQGQRSPGLVRQNANPDPEAHVFRVHPGQAVFDMICINCHGPNADSLGRQADPLQT